MTFRHDSWYVYALGLIQISLSFKAVFPEGLHENDMKLDQHHDQHHASVSKQRMLLADLDVAPTYGLD